MQYPGNNLFYDMQMPIAITFFTINSLAILFSMGQQLNTHMVILSDANYLTEWYRYPRSVQRYLPLLMMQSQRPFYLSAYGIMELNLENFVQVSE